jgi:hypothetical protein
VSVTLRMVVPDLEFDHEALDRVDQVELRVLRDLVPTRPIRDSRMQHIADDDLELRVRRARETAIPLPWAAPLLPFQVVLSSRLFEGLVAEACARQIRPTVSALRAVGLHPHADQVVRICQLLGAVAEAPAR